MEILITVKRDIVYSIDMTAEEFGALKEHEILAALDDCDYVEIADEEIIEAMTPDGIKVAYDE
ncbi:hypothetical protein [Pragia fontium]|uniref:hypothetical protein n=1 Tax=Pragia fontium TaxID=82985 RepID=UPI00064A5EAE|nr:hypothetical protein [Pragia fontium]AKJ41758.1 hypothetical protein QQ39_06395 [Pragia fontium]